MEIKQALQQLTDCFKEYVKGFDSDDPDVQKNIDLKRDHTFRVRDIIVDIGNSTGLNEDEMYIAEACALLHDIGRFEQYRRYGTFSDAASENHAAIAVRIIRKHDMLNNFPVKAAKTIIRAVGCHNLPSVAVKNKKKWILFLKLVRDADKIDILYVVTEYYQNFASGTNRTLELDLPDTPDISDNIYNPIVNGKLALTKNLKTLNDFKVYQMGWIYDLNFPKSYQLVKERNYLNKLRKALPELSKKADNILKKTSNFVEDKLKM